MLYSFGHAVWFREKSGLPAEPVRVGEWVRGDSRKGGQTEVLGDRHLVNGASGSNKDGRWVTDNKANSNTHHSLCQPQSVLLEHAITRLQPTVTCLRAMVIDLCLFVCCCFTS